MQAITIIVTTGSIEEIFTEITDHRSSSGLPFVTLSYAQSLDGSIAARRGAPLALSGEKSLLLTHQLRAAHDAILVGIGTVLADNPSLTVRLVAGRNPQPVILDSRLRFPREASMLKGDPQPWIATLAGCEHERAKILERAGARLLELPADGHGRVALPALLARLGTLGVRRLMVEGGASVITSFLSQRLVDLVVLTIAPVFVGGQNAIEALLSTPKGGTEDFPRLGLPHAAEVGSDLIVWGRPLYI